MQLLFDVMKFTYNTYKSNLKHSLLQYFCVYLRKNHNKIVIGTKCAVTELNMCSSQKLAWSVLKL